MHLLVTIVLVALVLVLAAGVALALFAAHMARRVDALLPPLGSFRDVPGARLHFIDRGSGPPVVLLHGLGGQARNFTHSLVDRLTGDFRVIVVDRPGAGHSRRTSGASASLGAQAAAIVALLRELDVTHPLLVGHSLGGALSLAIAEEHPALVGGLALVAPLTQVETVPPDAFGGLVIASPLVRRIVAWTLATPLAIRGGAAVVTSIFAPEPVPPDFGTAGGGLLSLRPRAFYETSTDLVAVNDDLPRIVAGYGALRLPVGILSGDDDHILDQRVHGERTAAEIIGATWEVVPGRGHMLPVTAPDEVAAFVRDVARRVG